MLLYETGIAAEPAEDAYGSGRKYKAGTPAQGVILRGRQNLLLNLLHHPPQSFGTVKTVPYRALYN